MKVCWGTTRTVLLIHRWAIKMPAMSEWRLFLLGLLANMQERSFGMTGWPKLCPVVFSIPGGWLVVMRRAEPLSEKQWNHLDVPGWRAEVDYSIPVEDKWSSFGVLDGEIVVVDYGN